MNIAADNGYRIRTVYQHGYRLERVEVKEASHEL